MRRKVEQAAVDHAIAHYTSSAGGTRSVKTVEKDNVGWDLEATSLDGELLRIEVKGLSGPQVVVEVTPNEYSKMKSERESYVIYILSEALLPMRKAHVFRFDAEKSCKSGLVWETDDGRRLAIQELMAARLSVLGPLS